MKRIFVSVILVLLLLIQADAKVNILPFGGGQSGDSGNEGEFDIGGATYYAVAEAGYSYSAIQTTNYDTRKYNTLSAAEAALSSSPSTPQVINILGTWTSADTTLVVFSGVSATVTNYTLVRTIDSTGSRHSGLWSTSAYRLEISGDNAITIEDDYTEIHGLQIYMTPDAHDETLIYINGSDGSTIKNNIIKGDIDNTSYRQRGIDTNLTTGKTAIILNNIIYNCSRDYSSGIRLFSSYPDFLVYNNTVYNCYYGIYGGGTNGTQVARNNLSYNNSSDDFYSTFDASSDYNFSKDDTAPGANSIHGDTDAMTPDFVSTTSGSEDFHIQGTSDAIDAGIGPSSDSDAPINDIDDDTRSGSTCDIGADEQ